MLHFLKFTSCMSCFRQRHTSSLRHLRDTMLARVQSTKLVAANKPDEGSLAATRRCAVTCYLFLNA